MTWLPNIAVARWISSSAEAEHSGRSIMRTWYPFLIELCVATRDRNFRTTTSKRRMNLGRRIASAWRRITRPFRVLGRFLRWLTTNQPCPNRLLPPHNIGMHDGCPDCAAFLLEMQAW